MATISVDTDTAVTGTGNDDLFRLFTSGSGGAVTIDAREGTDTAEFYTSGDYSTLIAVDDSNLQSTTTEGEITYNGDTLANFETLTFSNGTLDLTGSEVQYLASSTSRAANESFSANELLVFNPTVENGPLITDRNVDLQTVAGSSIEPNEAVVLTDQGTITLSDNGQELNFTAFTSFTSSIGIGNTENVSFDVVYLDDGDNNDDTDDETITLTYTVRVEGEASNNADRFLGTEEADSVDALGGDDFLRGQQGDDNLYGNDGDDRIYAGPDQNGTNGAVEADGNNDRDVYNDFFVGGAGNDIIGGNDGDDLLTGDDDSRMDDAIDGVTFDSEADGSDTIFGGNGNDEIHTGSWDDGNGSSSGTANDIAYGGNGNDIVVGANGDDEIGGGEGNDTVSGNEGDDIIYGGGGVDLLNGGDGGDTIFGGDGDDVVENIDAGTDGEEGTADDGPTTFSAGILGGNGDDELYNGDGDDIVAGDAGRDTLWGGEGDDTLEGGDDIDTFAFESGNGTDVIVDFEQGTDRVDVSELGFSDFDDLSENIGSLGGDTVLFYGDNDVINFNDAGNSLTLEENDFIF